MKGVILLANYDVLVIGAGPGGYVAAEEAARLGKTVAVIEKKAIGGACLNVGCIPSKTYLQHSQWLLTFDQARQYGIESQVQQLDFAKLHAHKDQVVASLQNGIRTTFKQAKIDYFAGEAQYLKGTTFLVEGEKITGKDVILATGSHPFVPPINGIDQVNYLTTNEFFDLATLPKRLVVIGGGVIAIELAFAMRPLGVEVTVIEVAPEILLTEDPVAREIIRQKLKDLGVQIFEGAQIANVKPEQVELVGESPQRFDQLLVATGRKPNTDLAKAIGLKLTDRGFIAFDQYYESSKAHFYAIGDILPTNMLAHVASAEGIKAVRAICRQAEEPVDADAIPRSLYTSPEVASFGMNEEVARAAGFDVVTGQLPFAYNGRAIATAKTDGFIRLISEKQYHLILGALIVGDHATDLLQELILLRNAEGTLDQIVDSVYAHPTISELIQDVAKQVIAKGARS